MTTQTFPGSTPDTVKAAIEYIELIKATASYDGDEPKIVPRHLIDNDSAVGGVGIIHEELSDVVEHINLGHKGFASAHAVMLSIESPLRCVLRATDAVGRGRFCR